MKIALITGVSGQDGSYLAELLLQKGYSVHGVVRRLSTDNYVNIDYLLNNPLFHIHYGDLSDTCSIVSIISKVRPHEIYNLAGQTHVKVSFSVPEFTTNVDAVGLLRILEAVRVLGMEKDVKIYQASTSELFGEVSECPQNENTPFRPRSPYACAKLYAYWIAVNYRQSYNMFISNGILFNHESPRRSKMFVTRKITSGVAAIKKGMQQNLQLGCLDAKRDWGYAPDYVKAMWLMLQQDTPDDFVIGTGNQYSVRDFCNIAFEYANMPIQWEGEGLNEKGIYNGKIVVEINKEFYRPSDVIDLKCDPTKAVKQLGWSTEVSFNNLVRIMYEHDIKLTLKREYIGTLDLGRRGQHHFSISYFPIGRYSRKMDTACITQGILLYSMKVWMILLII